MKNRPYSSSAFTLIELLVVISIIGMLSSVILASLSSAREKGRVAAIVKFETYNHRKLGANMIASYNFDYLSGGLIPDLSGNGYDLTMYSNASTDASDIPFGSGASLKVAISYDNARVNIASNQPTLAGSGSSGYSISLWGKTDWPNINSRYLFYITTSSGNGYAYCNASANMVVAFPNVSSFTVTSPSICSDSSKWHHMVFSTNGSTVNLYIDGKGVYSGNFSGASNGFTVSAINVGGRQSLPLSYRGHVDNFNIYNESLTAMDVQRIYAQESDKFNLALVP